MPNNERYGLYGLFALLALCMTTCTFIGFLAYLAWKNSQTPSGTTLAVKSLTTDDIRRAEKILEILNREGR